MVDDKYKYENELEEEQGGLEYCTFDDDLPHLTEAELRDKEDSFEWYYFDIDTTDLQIAIRYIIKDTSIHETKPAITFELRQNQKEVTKRIKDYSLDEYKKPVVIGNNEGVMIEIGTNKLKIYRDSENNIKKYLLTLKFDEIDLTLECTPMHRGFKVSGNRSYVTKKSNDDIYSCAAFPAPRMKGEGKLKLGNDYERKISGEGYHDHPWGTTSLMYSHKEWHWGRIFTKEFTVFFTKVFPSDGYYGKLDVLYFAKTGTTMPTLEEDLEITPENWKTDMSGFPITLRFPQELSIKSLKRNLSLKTKFKEILILIKVYIRIKVEASVIENTNNLSGTGWVEYLKIPSTYIIQKAFMFFTKRDYNSDKWRKKQDYEHLLS